MTFHTALADEQQSLVSPSENFCNITLSEMRDTENIQLTDVSTKNLLAKMIFELLKIIFKKFINIDNEKKSDNDVELKMHQLN